METSKKKNLTLIKKEFSVLKERDLSKIIGGNALPDKPKSNSQNTKFTEIKSCC